MNYDEVKLRRLIGKCQWTFAKTMPTCPHEYIVRNKCALSDEEFVFFCAVTKRIWCSTTMVEI